MIAHFLLLASLAGDLDILSKPATKAISAWQRRW